MRRFDMNTVEIRADERVGRLVAGDIHFTLHGTEWGVKDFFFRYIPKNRVVWQDDKVWDGVMDAVLQLHYWPLEDSRWKHTPDRSQLWVAEEGDEIHLSIPGPMGITFDGKYEEMLKAASLDGNIPKFNTDWLTNNYTRFCLQSDGGGLVLDVEMFTQCPDVRGFTA